MNSLPIQALTPDAFAPFGTVIDWSEALERTGQSFHVVLRSPEPTGWRLAAQKVTARAAHALANHPDTEELFAPIQGRCVLLVALRGPFDEASVAAFLLDRPACVARGVWHASLALSEAATVLIAENLEVSSERAELSRALSASLV
ncbi:MAG: ureidoglycolate lyase [Chloroflexota bacterium]